MDDLIRKMQQEMVIRHYSPRRVKSYLWHVNAFKAHIQKPPDQVTEDDIRSYLYHVKTVKQYSRSNLHQAFSAIKYLYRHTLQMPLKLNALKGVKRGRPLPLVLSTDEIQTLFATIANLKHRLLLMTIYSAGLPP